MFLANLTEKQKPAFLSLAYALILADGILSDDEISMVEQYKLEMALTINLEELQGETEQAVCVFKTASMTVKKKVIFELIALAYADNDYAIEENHLLSEIVESFGMDSSFLDECRMYVEKLTDLYKRIGELMSE